MSRRKVLTGPILILGAVQLIESLAFALPLSFFPNYVLTLGASVASVGLFTSSFMIAFAVMSPRMGGLIDRYGRKRMMVYGIASDVLIGTITGLAPTWQWLLLIRLLNGAVSSAAMLAHWTAPPMRGPRFLPTICIDIRNPMASPRREGSTMSTR